jgi:hypothetical protein
VLTVADISPFGIFIDPTSSDISVPGRDVTNNFDMLYSYPMTFGAGPHFCIGAQLTRLEAKLAMEILLQRFDRLKLQEPNITWIDSYFARGPQQLPVRVNVTVMFKLCRQAAPHLKASGAGRIINLASITAVQVQPRLSAYAASKHVVAGLTKVLAVELEPDQITANYLIPGVILTAMTKPIMDSDPAMKVAFESFSVLGRVGQPIDVARAALFLASNEASFITDHGLAIDGGRLAKL